MNQIDLHGRAAIVTGAARGIGLAIVERLLSSGARCCLWDVDEARLAQSGAELQKQHGIGRVLWMRADVTDPAGVDAATARVLEGFGQIDVLVNNAAIAGPSRKLWECSPHEWEEVLRVDLLSVFICCRAIVPHMIERKYGRIVNIASIAGKEGNPNASHYSAAKAGVIAMTKSLAKELARTGVLANCIAPAVIETEILKQITQEHVDYMLARIPMGRFGLKEEAAAMAAWLSSEDCSFSTGAVFDLSGGRATY